MSYSSDVCNSPSNVDPFDDTTLRNLESSGSINWWKAFTTCGYLRVLKTKADGNCLLHAASLAVSNVEDDQHQLRSALQNFLLRDDYEDKLYKIWREHQEELNAENHIVFNDENWKTEWNDIKNLTKPNGEMKYLEKIHIFALSQLIQRPIIIYANEMLCDNDGMAIDAIGLRGLYLPIFAAEKRLQFNKSPVLLAFNQYHFSAVIATTNVMPIRIPLVDNTFVGFPTHYVDTSHNAIQSSQCCFKLVDFLKVAFAEDSFRKILCCIFD